MQATLPAYDLRLPGPCPATLLTTGKLMSDTSTNGFSSDKLMQIATKLGLDIEIHVKTAETENGDVVIAA